MTNDARSIPSPARSSEIPALPAGTRLTTLENGLTIITREDHSSPVVSAQAWCRAGSIDEGRWLGAGLSHLLEHMLFKGTTTRGAGRIDQAVQEVGGSMNAYTSFDRTVFYINVPNTGVGVAIDILCDVMQHATLPEEELEKEKKVILREMDMNQDDPGRRASRRLFETAYTRSPYRYTVIGYPDIFNELRTEDIHGYYKEKYAPNNLFFVVVGDMQAAEVEEQIRNFFREAKAKPLAPVALPVEPPQAGQREVIEEAAIQLAHFHFAWHIPDVRHPDIPALDVLATLLGSGCSSRLYQNVREKTGVVHSADAWTYNPGNPGLFGMSGVADADRFDPARAALLAELDWFRDRLVSEAELSKAVKQFISGTFATRKTMQGQANDLGANWLAASDLNFSERYLAAVKNLRPEALREVARKYLTVDNRTLYALLPSGTLGSGSAAVVATASKPVQRLVLENGLTLLLQEDRKLPFVEMRAVFRGGVLSETAANNGGCLLMSKMFLKGTPTRSAQEIVTAIESMGGSIDQYGGNNSFGLSAEVLGSDFESAFDIFCDVMLHPAFPTAAFEREREIQLAGIRAQKDHLLQRAVLAMRRTMFGAMGYGLDTNGSEESVTALPVSEAAALHRALVVPGNSVLAIAGEVNPESARRTVQEKLNSWRGARPNHGANLTSPELTTILETIELHDKKQAVLVLGFKGTTLQSPDRYPLDLLQEALSDMGSRLFLRIREKLGLAYYVGAQNFVGLIPGCFLLYAGTAPESVDQVRAELLAEVEMLRIRGLTAEELGRAKAKVIGHRKIGRQDLGARTMSAALDELYGLGYDNCEQEDGRYESVALEQIHEAAVRHLTLDAHVISIAKPA